MLNPYDPLAVTIKNQISNKWLKASVLGCLWASAEIVLGSFLHNLKIPFAGNILTAIGIILLISVSHIWKEKGLFWRSGLVCALMKSMSPSAIIIGPMIAIFCEALLMEVSVRIFRRNIFSYLLAGMLAMLWNLFFLVGNFVVMYGMNIVDLYVNLTEFAQKQLHITNGNYWTPVLYLTVIYLVLGLIAAIFGISIGRKASVHPVKAENLTVEQVLDIKSKRGNSSVHFSFVWLLCNVVLIITEYILMSYTAWYIWMIMGTALIVAWILRYRNAFRSLARPGFWITFVVITMVSGFVLFKLGNKDSDFVKGILIGLEMNFRAAVTIIGFLAIGTELRNPRLMSFFAKSRLKQLPLALEIAFDTLPLMVSNLPKVRDVFRKPAATFRTLVSHAEHWLEKAEFKIEGKENVVIISGTEKTGKSTLLKKIVFRFRNENIKIAGFTSPAVFEKGVRLGYNLVDITSEKNVILSRILGNEDMPKVGSYFFNPEGILFGKKLLDIENLRNVQVAVIDEIGPWELRGQGWAESLNQIVKLFPGVIMLVVRESIVEKVIENWSFRNPLIVDIEEKNMDAVCDKIIALLDKSNK